MAGAPPTDLAYTLALLTAAAADRSPTILDGRKPKTPQDSQDARQAEAARLRLRRGPLAFVVMVSIACGPAVSSGGSAGDADGTTTAQPSTSATASGSTSSSTSMTTTDTTTTADGGSTITSETSPPDLPGASCPSPPPMVEPPLPSGCAHVWLVDAKGNAIEGAYSGFVVCADARGFESVLYRTAAIACPQLLGAECLCDADCDAGEACICANTFLPGFEPANRCMPSDCGSADDCRGQPCRVDVGPCLGTEYPEAMRCTTPADDCVFPSECSPRRGQLCDYDALNEIFTCDPGAICE